MQTAKLAVLFFFVTLSSATTVAATVVGAPNCGGVHRVGDLITCYVKFAGKTDFKDLQVVFNLPREDKPRTRGTQINFVLRDTKKLSSRAYSVSGVLPDCVPGTYILAAVVARNSLRYQQYQNLPDVQIAVENGSDNAAAASSKNEAPPSTVGISSSSGTVVPAAASVAHPHVVETPPPDPTVFPAIARIMPAPVAAAPSVDLVSWFARFFHKPDSCGGKHQPGDTVVCRIQFEGNPHLQMVALFFIRDEPQTTVSEKQLCRGFGVGMQPDDAPVAPGLYELKREVPGCSAGNYKITSVTAFAYSGADKTVIYAKTYVVGSDFKSTLVLNLKDTLRSEFPAVVEVGNKF